MCSAFLPGEVVSPACAAFLTVVVDSCAVTVPVITSGQQWRRCRYDAADHPAQLGLALPRWGAA
jgi:hypothetical protein